MLAAVRVVFPAERNLAVGDVSDAMVGILSRGIKQLRSQWQIAVARSLSLMHMNGHQAGIDIADFQPRGFCTP